MANIVFLLHGMGMHPAKWSESAVKALEAAYAREEYKTLQRRPFDKRFTIIELEYDSIFRSYVESWSAGANNILNAGPAAELGDVTKLVSWFKKAGEGDNNFAWTHAADVLMYRGFGSVRAEIRAHVANQIIKGLDGLRPSQTWSIVAHSLGTAVAHDALNALWHGGGMGGLPTGYEADKFSAQVVAMIANVSRVMQTTPKVFDSSSYVSPGAVGSPDHGCSIYLNVRHKYDPFTWVKPSDPERWPTQEATENGMYIHVEPEHLWDINAHDIAHYIQSPHVHIPLFRALTYRGAVTLAEEETALKKFKPLGPNVLTEDVAATLKGKLEKLRPAGDADWPKFEAVWDGLEKLL